MASSGADTSNSQNSIVQARPDRVQAVRALLSSPARRVRMADEYRDDGEHINLSQLPRVRGDWKWLEPEDDTFARALGYTDPLDVTMARVQGHLTDAVDTRTPDVRFIPHPRYFNPTHQPTAQGQWEYYTSASKQLAHLNFGQAAQHGLQNVPRPTARQIWQVRETYLAEERGFGTTEDIDLVWIPRSQIESSIRGSNGQYLPPTNASPGPSPPSSPSAASVPSSPPRESQDAPFGTDPYNGLGHDPTNGGDHDQTGRGDRARYFTETIKGTAFTMDTSVARVHDPEPHKGYALMVTGRFKQWEHYNEIDWKDVRSIDALNRWRHQNISRTFNREIRKEKRGPYTPDQKDHLWKEVAKRNGGRPTGKELEKITDEFNATFHSGSGEPVRKKTGITSLIYRMVDEWKQNGGKRKRGEEEKKKRRRLQRRAEEARRRGEENEVHEGSDTEIKNEDADDDEDTETTAKHENDGSQVGDGASGAEEGVEEDEEMTGVGSGDDGEPADG